jgi:hypothetical protein
MSNWEYLILSLPAFGSAKDTQGQSPAVELLNRQGAAGWEAVGMTVLSDGSVAGMLKRPRQASA